MLILQNLVNNRWVSKGHKPKPSWHMRILVLHYHRISDLPVLAEMFIECFCHDTIVCKLIGNLLNTYKPGKKTLKKLLTVRELDQAYIFKNANPWQANCVGPCMHIMDYLNAKFTHQVAPKNQVKKRQSKTLPHSNCNLH